jgi:hypothetical protein
MFAAATTLFLSRFLGGLFLDPERRQFCLLFVLRFGGITLCVRPTMLWLDQTRSSVDSMKKYDGRSRSRKT